MERLIGARARARTPDLPRRFYQPLRKRPAAGNGGAVVCSV